MKGRVPYTEDDDEAIIVYLKKNKIKDFGPGSAKGDAIWHQLEREQITNHSWQSMKARYRDKLMYKIQSMSMVKMVPSGNDVIPVALQNDTKKDTTSSHFGSRKHCSKSRLLPKKRAVYSPASETDLSSKVVSKKSKYFQYEISSVLNHNEISLKNPNDITNNDDGEKNNCNDVSVLKKIDFKVQRSSSSEKTQVVETNFGATSDAPLSPLTVTQRSDSVDMSDIDDSFDDFLIQAAISSQLKEKGTNTQPLFDNNILVSDERPGTLEEEQPFTFEEFNLKKEKFRCFLQELDNYLQKVKDNSF
ncbi:telomeric repeat-binding factor 2-interacting protein 1 isoform X1 [Hydra vulgaris]|uniref:telomeric repeat-binding factor 2-interacting protein 1 isoform X1 n=2 Tax=Hydra vulgaris TaxID=6087 RepID=UPI001F5E8A7C|nr:telomeric repeat-binding factor 2-interacting protein 1 isoform X1 [Hydra vulgaris]